MPYGFEAFDHECATVVIINKRGVCLDIIHCSAAFLPHIQAASCNADVLPQPCVVDPLWLGGQQCG